jgi:hypothetical protein
MSAALRRAAFVVGVPRSGTTLFARLLDGHPQLFVLPFETHASVWAGRPDPVTPLLGRIARFQKLEKGSPQEQQLERALRARLPGAADLETLLRGTIDALFEQAGSPPRAEVWVEKTPRHLRVVPELLRIFGPETRVLALVRDPRAVMASRRTRFERIGAGNVRHFAQRWAYADALVRRCQARFPAFLAIRYEDLVADAEAVMRRAADHLGIAWDPVLVQPTRSGEEWRGNSSFGRGTQSGVSREYLDRWRKELVPEDVARLELLLRDRMRAWGYEPLSRPRAGPSLRRLAVEVVTALRQVV